VLQKLGMKRLTYQQPVPVNPGAQVGLHGDFGPLLFAQNDPLDGRIRNNAKTMFARIAWQILPESLFCFAE
jgi:hypothetical protein